jgi:hypothetical protein
LFLNLNSDAGGFGAVSQLTYQSYPDVTAGFTRGNLNFNIYGTGPPAA